MFFVDEVRKAVEIWNGVHSQSTLYFLPVGRIHDAYELQKDVIWYEGSRPLGCFDSWERYFPYCRDYVRLLKKGKLSAYLKPRIDAMNNGLRTLAREWERKQLSNHFAYLDGVENSPYEREFFALDCFHLSEAGQNTLAHSIMDAVNFNQNLFLNRL